MNSDHFRGGGDSTYTFNLAELLQEHGHAVAHFAMQDPQNLANPDSDLFVSHINYREMAARNTPSDIIRVLWRSIYSVEARRKFALLLDRFQPDVIHLQNIHAHITPSVILEANKRRLPVVWTLHDYKTICPNTHFLLDSTGQICEACGVGRNYQPILKRCKKGSLRASIMISIEAYVHRALRVRERVDAFLAPSRFLRDKLLSRGFPPAKVHHLPYFVAPNLYQIQTQNTQGDYLLYLGRITPIKGIPTLLQACRMAPTVRLVLAGRVDDSLNAEMANLPPNVQYVGTRYGDDLWSLLDGSIGAVQPSIWYENQPFSILEAFTRGKPVIASDLGGMTELVVHRERGLLVPPGDASRLAEAMLWLTAHRAEAQQMGSSAYRYVLQHHHPEQHYVDLMSIYDKARAA